MSTPRYKIELWNQGPKVGILRVMTYKHDNDVIEINVHDVIILFHECEVNMTQVSGLNFLVF